MAVMSAADYEKLGLFYLGKHFDLDTGTRLNDLVLYDSRDLLTHAVIVGMTGSGKTGLGISLIEEAAIDGIPVLAIDPKGDLGNLLLTFPDLAASDFAPWIDAGEAQRHNTTVDAYAAETAQRWKAGLAEWDQDGARITRLKAAADVTVFFSKNPGFNPRTAMLLDEYQERGGGLVYLHWAVNGDEHALVLAERIGLAGGKSGVKFRHGEFDLVFKQPEHPVTRGLPTLHFTDETYWAMQGDPARIRVLGTGVEEGEPRPQLWAMERHKGRVIGCVPGHYTWTFDDPYFRLLVLRAICWTAKEENVERLADLATVGARVSE